MKVKFVFILLLLSTIPLYTYAKNEPSLDKTTSFIKDQLKKSIASLIVPVIPTNKFIYIGPIVPSYLEMNGFEDYIYRDIINGAFIDIDGADRCILDIGFYANKDAYRMMFNFRDLSVIYTKDDTFDTEDEEELVVDIRGRMGFIIERNYKERLIRLPSGKSKYARPDYKVEGAKFTNKARIKVDSAKRATRLRNAFKYAIELCEGKDSLPF